MPSDSFKTIYPFTNFSSHFEGIQQHTSVHPCFVCSGSKVDEIGEPTGDHRARWRTGDKRTLESNLLQHQRWLDDTASNNWSPTEARKNLSMYYNCHLPPFTMNKDRQKPIFWFCPFDPLHTVKVIRFIN